VQSDYQVTAAADRLAGEIQIARLLAVSRDATLQVVLHDTGAYEVVDPVDSANPPRAAKALPSGVTFKSMPQQPLTFYARGNALGGTIRVGNDAFSRQITVTPSGKVTVL